MIDNLSRGKIMKNFYLFLYLLFNCLYLVYNIYGNTHNKNGIKDKIDLTQLSIEDLMNIEVKLVSRKDEILFNAGAAISVITQDDIRRTGITNIPDALRMIPGMQVARFDANKWAISSRGFNGIFANKLLVLIDGRSVYTPMFSGVFWQVQNILLEDIDRIEVIRGPGATMWGSNAVNGIINILTKSSEETQGLLINLGIGTEEKSLGNIRYGGKFGDDLYFRIYTKYHKSDNLINESGHRAFDGWNVIQEGFKIDWNMSNKNTFTLQGDIYNEKTGQSVTIASLLPPFYKMVDYDISISGNNLLGRWEHFFSNSSDLALQFYYDTINAKDTILIDGHYNTFDIDFQHRFCIGNSQEIVWGLGYRNIADDLDSTSVMWFNPQKRNYDLFSAFIQNNFVFLKNQFYLSVGSKFEHNEFSGFEIQPSLRLKWILHRKYMIWGALSRAVRTPSRGDQDSWFIREIFSLGEWKQESPMFFVAPMGNKRFKTENCVAFELGSRFRPKENLFFDLATFYTIYDKLRTYEKGESFSNSSTDHLHIILPFYEDNKMYGKTYGFEMFVNWRLHDKWLFFISYTYLIMQLKLRKDSNYSGTEDIEGENPDHQLSFRSSIDLLKNIKMDIGFRYVDDLPSLNIKNYLNLDICLSWQTSRNLELSVVGRNLLQSPYYEYRGVAIPFISTKIERSLHGVINWRL
jgi:iron complex outermembrane receptor protein